eukprot:287783_1
MNHLNLRMNQLLSCSQHFCNVSKDMERWKVINGFSNYQVSSLGNVKNIKRNKLLKIGNARFQMLNAVPTVNLTSDEGKRKRHTVGRLVLNTFDPRDTTDTLFAIHID